MILNILLNVKSPEDVLVRHFTLNEGFTIKSAYQLALSQILLANQSASSLILWMRIAGHSGIFETSTFPLKCVFLCGKLFITSSHANLA